MRYDKQTFENAIVELDDNEFVACHFESCELVYSGFRPPRITGCSFVRVQITFAGGAENTLRFMADLYASSGAEGRQIIEDTFDTIRRGFSTETVRD
jgi:hypothetical protein